VHQRHPSAQLLPRLNPAFLPALHEFHPRVLMSCASPLSLTVTEQLSWPAGGRVCFSHSFGDFSLCFWTCGKTARHGGSAQQREPVTSWRGEVPCPLESTSLWSQISQFLPPPSSTWARDTCLWETLVSKPQHWDCCKKVSCRCGKQGAGLRCCHYSVFTNL
jgi:hypothetical protein